MVAGKETSGDRLMAKLESVGKSRLWLASQSNVTYKTVCRLASGDMLGNLDTWARFAKALDCTISELTGV